MRVPSGKRISACPPVSTSSAERIASRSAVPRLTGNAPNWINAAPSTGTLNNESFAMKKTLRREMNSVKAKSRFERWMGATSTGPLTGMLCCPRTLGRKNNRTKLRRTTAVTR